MVIFQDPERQKELRERARKLIAEARAGIGKSQDDDTTPTRRVSSPGAGRLQTIFISLFIPLYHDCPFLSIIILCPRGESS